MADTTVEHVVATQSDEHIVAGQPVDAVADFCANERGILWVLAVIAELSTDDVETLLNDVLKRHDLAVSKIQRRNYWRRERVVCIKPLDIDRVVR